MTTHAPSMTDARDSLVACARDAEQRLFDTYHLPVTEHRIELGTPAMGFRVLDIGRGPPVLLMPGGIGEAWQFASLIAQLRNVRVLAINRPGGGLSDGVDFRAVDIRALAIRTVEAVLDHFGIDRAPIVANSMGGLWTFWFALARPERVSAIVQLGTPALILDTSAPLPMRLMSVPGLNRPLVRMMVPSNLEKVRDVPRFLGHAPEVGARWSEAELQCGYWFPRLPTFQLGWRSLMERVLRLGGARSDVQFGADELSRVQQPVHFVWGDHDPFGSVAAAKRAEAVTPHATLALVQGGGHLPWWDDVAMCARIVRECVARQ